jgi:hypothetical protein
MFAETFDTTVAISGLYLWLLFSYLAAMMNCDLQRLMQKNTLFKHLVAIIAFFFLFTVIDANNKAHVGIIWLKTLFVYVLFLMMIKSKWYFTFPVLFILLVDQTIKAHISYLEKNGTVGDIEYYQNIRAVLNIIIIVLTVLGFVHYIFRKKSQFGSSFSFSTLLLDTKCYKI